MFDWELYFMIYFGLLFIRLSWFYDIRIILSGLTQVDLTLLSCHLIFFFLQMSLFKIGSNMVDWKFSFMIFFYLLSAGLSQSHDQNHGFDRLTWVKSSLFIFSSMRLSWSHYPGHEFDKLTRADWELNFVIYFYLFSMRLFRS